MQSNLISNLRDLISSFEILYRTNNPLLSAITLSIKIELNPIYIPLEASHFISHSQCFNPTTTLAPPMASPTKYLVLCLALFFFIVGTESRILPEASMRQRYQEWITRYGKQYTTMEETESRYQIFAENAKRIDAFNAAAGDKTYTLGLNQYADLADDEFETSRKGFKPEEGRRSSSRRSSSFQYEDVSVSSLPSYVDWREKGAVTPVKDQGACGKLGIIYI